MSALRVESGFEKTEISFVYTHREPQSEVACVVPNAPDGVGRVSCTRLGVCKTDYKSAFWTTRSIFNLGPLDRMRMA